MNNLSTQQVAPSWQTIIRRALQELPNDYYDFLLTDNNWLPGPDKIFNAFSLPIEQVRYVMFGESPYPRSESANGYAFWDGAVQDLWSSNGLSKKVNRASSLRNFIKMLLVAQGSLSNTNLNQTAIADLDKSAYVQNIAGLFGNILRHGILPLNASLALTSLGVKQDARAWYPFMKFILEALVEHNPAITLILFGNFAKEINKIPITQKIAQLHCEHPYNLSFITNPKVLEFFKPLQLLQR